MPRRFAPEVQQDKRHSLLNECRVVELLRNSVLVMPVLVGVFGRTTIHVPKVRLMVRLFRSHCALTREIIA